MKQRVPSASALRPERRFHQNEPKENTLILQAARTIATTPKGLRGMLDMIRAAGPVTASASAEPAAPASAEKGEVYLWGQVRPRRGQRGLSRLRPVVEELRRRRCGLLRQDLQTEDAEDLDELTGGDEEPAINEDEQELSDSGYEDEPKYRRREGKQGLGEGFVTQFWCKRAAKRRRGIYQGFHNERGPAVHSRPSLVV